MISVATHVHTFFPVVTSLMAQFPNVNPYRWPGWFLVALALMYALVMLLIFRETRPYYMPKHCKRCSCTTGVKLSAQLSSRWHIRMIVSYKHLCSEMFSPSTYMPVQYALHSNTRCLIYFCFLSLVCYRHSLTSFQVILL